MARINMDDYYICWSSRLLPIIFDAGFELCDSMGKFDNPFLDMKKRYLKDGSASMSQKTGYVFLRTPELMELVGMHSNRDK